jgi:BirA family biotin operon repressor/biotin-[acetyl-CoA-carboxylase] ligase
MRLHGSAFERLARPGARTVGSSVFHYASLPSTMDAAASLSGVGVSEGAVVVADTQTRGRGRHGRQWQSTAADNLLVSVVLYPRPGIAGQVSIAAALAVRQAVLSVTGVLPALKWPNDVRHAGRKLCGVLVEMHQGQGLVAVAGIGLNVNSAPDDSEGVRATSLSAISGRLVDRVRVLDSLLGSFDRYYVSLVEGNSLVPEWAGALETIGQRVTVTFLAGAPRDQTVSGIAEGVDELGRLLVRDDGGRLWPLAAGEVTLQAPPPGGSG